MLAFLFAFLTVTAVNSGDNLQTAMNNASPGDTLVLEANATFTGNFTMPTKTNPNNLYIYVESSLLSSIPRSRIHPSNSALLPKLKANSGIILTNADTAHHWIFRGIEFTAPSAVKLTTLVQLGNNETVLSDIPSYIEFERCYFHGDSLLGARRGLLGDAKYLKVERCYFSDFKDVIGPDTQAIWMYNTPGPFLVWDNYLEGGGENFFTCGADPQISGLQPADGIVGRNTLSKPDGWNFNHPSFGHLDSDALTTHKGNTLSSTGTSVTSTAHGIVDVDYVRIDSGPQAGEVRQVATITNANAFVLVSGFSQNQSSVSWSLMEHWWMKNLFELKCGARIKVVGNYLERDWNDGQYVAVNVKSENQNGGATWVETNNILFENNYIRYVKAGITISGIQGSNSAVLAHDIVVRNNIFDDVGWIYSGPVSDASPRAYSVQSKAIDVTADHNVFHCELDEGTGYYVDSPSVPLLRPITKNNIFVHATYGLKGPGFGEGSASINAMATSPSTLNNLFVGTGATTSGYPATTLATTNTFASIFAAYPDNFSLAASSAYAAAGTDGKDLGVDWTEFQGAFNKRRTRWR